jgi:hypothetical protein
MPRPAEMRFSGQPGRRYLEPGPIVLVSSKLAREDQHHGARLADGSRVFAFLGRANDLGGNPSFQMIRNSSQCVINLPTTALTDTVVGIGTTSGSEIDKFAHFGLTAEAATKVDARLSANAMRISNASCTTTPWSTSTISS